VETLHVVRSATELISKASDRQACTRSSDISEGFSNGAAIIAWAKNKRLPKKTTSIDDLNIFH